MVAHFAEDSIGSIIFTCQYLLHVPAFYCFIITTLQLNIKYRRQTYISHNKQTNKHMQRTFDYLI